MLSMFFAFLFCSLLCSMLRTWEFENKNTIFFLSCLISHPFIGWDISLDEPASQVLAQPSPRAKRSAFGPTFLENLENFDATSVPCQCLMWEAMISMVFINFLCRPIPGYSIEAPFFTPTCFFPCFSWLSNTLPSIAFVGLPFLSPLNLEPFLEGWRKIQEGFAHIANSLIFKHI